jgi:hypothetical protein
VPWITNSLKGVPAIQAAFNVEEETMRKVAMDSTKERPGLLPVAVPPRRVH